LDFGAEVERLKALGVTARQLILIDDVLLRAAVAWPNVSREFVSGIEVSDVWDLVSFDPFEWMSLAGLPSQVFRSVFLRCKRLNLVFPDGEIPREVVALANQRVRGMLEQ